MAPPPAQSAPPPSQSSPDTADSIMARVAANQDASEAERAHYVYVQHTKMASRKGKTVQCEELTDYRITPSSDGSHDELLKLDGRLRVKGKYVPYNTLAPSDDTNQPKKDPKSPDPQPAPQDQSKAQNQSAPTPKDPPSADGQSDALTVNIGEEGLDRDLVENMRKNLMHDKSKDGINAHLFPLTSKEQQTYAYTLLGRERLNGRDVFHIAFRPRDKNDFGWKGEAYIDTQAYQPVLVSTAMARKIPFAVRTLLGTNVPGLGFTVVYAPQPDGVWFPVSFSTEFKIHVLYFFHRDIVLDAQNRQFEKTHVTSRVLEGVTEAPQP
ncbi:hypothetical protein DYQ86_10180 [Acidobacteria bacterium AB60]|nr:hypothetical protein DYQ86_10180 [Acidobacteria bacterium AB60]